MAQEVLLKIFAGIQILENFNQRALLSPSVSYVKSIIIIIIIIINNKTNLLKKISER